MPQVSAEVKDDVVAVVVETTAGQGTVEVPLAAEGAGTWEATNGERCEIARQSWNE